MRKAAIFLATSILLLAGCASLQGAAGPSDPFPPRSPAEQAHDKCVATVTVVWVIEFDKIRTKTFSNQDNSIINGIAQMYGSQSPEFTTYVWAMGQTASVARGEMAQPQLAEGIKARCR